MGNTTYTSKQITKFARLNVKTIPFRLPIYEVTKLRDCLKYLMMTISRQWVPFLLTGTLKGQLRLIQ